MVFLFFGFGFVFLFCFSPTGGNDNKGGKGVSQIPFRCAFLVRLPGCVALFVLTVPPGGRTGKKLQMGSEIHALSLTFILTCFHCLYPITFEMDCIRTSFGSLWTIIFVIKLVLQALCQAWKGRHISEG